LLRHRRFNGRKYGKKRRSNTQKNRCEAQEMSQNAIDSGEILPPPVRKVF